MHRDCDNPGPRVQPNLGDLQLTALAAASHPLFGLPLSHKGARRPARTRGAGLVLIVDDSEDTRRIYSEYLNFRGFWTVTAPDGEVSIPMVHDLKPDVIVMDLAMPRLDGVSAIRRLKESPSAGRIPVILLTGHAMQVNPTGCDGGGC